MWVPSESWYGTKGRTNMFVKSKKCFLVFLFRQLNSKFVYVPGYPDTVCPMYMSCMCVHVLYNKSAPCFPCVALCKYDFSVQPHFLYFKT